MSKATNLRTTKRADQYRRFQGFIYQELETARRWSTYCPCEYGWLCELDDHQYFYTVLKYLMKNKEIDIYSLSSSDIPEVLKKLDNEEFLLCLHHVSSTGSTDGFLSDTHVSNQEISGFEEVVNLPNLSVSADNVISAPSTSGSTVFLRYDLHEDTPLHGSQDVGQEEDPPHQRSESITTYMMNQYSDEAMPVVVIASQQAKEEILNRSVHPIRDFDSRLNYSPITISTNGYLLRCGKHKMFLDLVNGQRDGVKYYEYVRRQNVMELFMDKDGNIHDSNYSYENLLNRWLHGHHYQVNATNDLDETHEVKPPIKRTSIRKKKRMNTFIRFLKYSKSAVWKKRLKIGRNPLTKRFGAPPTLMPP